MAHLPQGPAASNGGTFDPKTGSLLERSIFNNRPLFVAVCLALSVFFALSLRGVTLNASYQSMVPLEHPFIQAFIQHRDELHLQGNNLRIIVEARRGDIFSKEYLETLRQLNDDVFLLPGVDRSYMQSLWTSATRWISVTEDGFAGGAVMPDHFSGVPDQIAQVRQNVARSGVIGQLVAADMRSSIILVPLLETNPDTGRSLDYGDLARRLDGLRLKYGSAAVGIRITGFAQVVGDLIAGLHEVLGFFAVSILIATAMVYWFTHCARSTALVVACSLIAVIWLLGLLPYLHLGLDPYSILVPFLVFAIGMSHGAQKMNGVMQDIGRGLSNLAAARMTFRRLFMAGFTALVCDAVGFAVLLVIHIEAIRQLALIASLGVAILVFTNLILLPILLSYVGVSRASAARSLRSEQQALAGAEKHPLWAVLDRFTERRWAAAAIFAAGIVAAGAYIAGSDLKIGDLNQGAPELRPDSRYNRDNGYLNEHYATSSDVFAIMVTTPDGACASYATEQQVDQLEGELKRLPGVEATQSLADLTRGMVSALNEASPQWYELVPNQGELNTITQAAPRELLDEACNLLPVYVYLADHRAETLTRVVQATQAFAQAHDSAQVHYLLAAGNAGIEAATNDVVEGASRRMLYYVYAAVIVLSLATFRSWRGVLVAVLPLMLTSLVAQALMVFLGIGVKVATLPVTALGVGIGVDYALYILSVTMAFMREGQSLSEAYYRALLFTGKVVALTGLTLAAGVATWAFSPIKFQADMGILLAFMFLLNMLGALVLLPALSCFLLKPTVHRKEYDPMQASRTVRT